MAAQRTKPSRRRRAREMALQMLYQHEMGGTSVDEVVSRFDPRAALLDVEDGVDAESGDLGAEYAASIDPKALDYAGRLVLGVDAHRAAIDELIQGQAEHWRLERMLTVDRAILRLAVYEFLHEADVPKLVVVDEAIELAKRFGAEQSGAFVNGLLDGMLKKHTFPGRMT